MWLLLLIPLLGMTSVLFARTEKAVNLDDKLRFTSGNAEMSYRIPEPANASIAVPRPETIWIIGDDEVISDEDKKDERGNPVMLIRQRNAMTIQINKNNEIYVRNGLVNRVIKIDELKDLAKQFIQNPDNDSRLPILEDYDIEGYGTVKTTIKHIFSLQYDRSAASGTWSDVRYELQKAYNEIRDELCMSKFGKKYDQCSDSQQRFARAMYAMKISEAQPIHYDAEGNAKEVKVRSAAANPELAKTNKVNKDLKIRVTNNPVRLYASTVLFDNENGQDQFKSESAPKQILLEELNDYIDQAISDGMKIRKVRFAIHPNVPMGPIIDLKETVRNRMLLNIVQESYKEPALVVKEHVEDDEIFNGLTPKTIQYIRDSINYPDEAKEDPNRNVLASFTIGKDGNVMNPDIIGSADPALDEEALKVLSQMPAWIPARNENGEVIEVKYTIPVSTTTASKSLDDQKELDVRFQDPSTGQQMNLTSDIAKLPVLLLFDNNIIEKDNNTNVTIDPDKGTYSKKELADILNLKQKQVKAYMVLKGVDATSVWGARGVNGVIQVISPKVYSQLQKDGKLDARYRLAN